MGDIKERLAEKYDVNDFTLKATDILRDTEENRELLIAIQAGDSSKFEEILKGIVENKLTWGDHIARYIYRHGGKQLEGEALREYIMKAFEDNGMKQRGSMDPERSTKLGSQLNRWLESPVTRISRKTCFLFCFGLNMNEQDASTMLRILRQPDFVPRDYEEAIYYYCLRNNLQYAGVEEWLRIYGSLLAEGENEDPAEDDDFTTDSNTRLLRDGLRYVANLEIEKIKKDAEFTSYLRMLIKMPENKRQSNTRAKVYRSIYRKFCENFSEHHYMIDENTDKNCFDAFEEVLKRFPTNHIQVPEIIQTMAAEKLISIPALSSSSLEKKIGGEQSTEINREDILTIVFLYCSCGVGYKAGEEKYNYAKRKARFIYLASRRLEAAGFGDVYLLNPYELFLVSCLLQPKPLEYFLAIWKQCRAKE
jgi:hypothetical protein